MACNCTTKEQLDELYRLYGEKQQRYRAKAGGTIGERIKYWVQTLAIWILLLIAVPFIILYFIIKLFWEDNPKIDINNFNLLRIFKLKGNVG